MKYSIMKMGRVMYIHEYEIIDSQIRTRFELYVLLGHIFLALFIPQQLNCQKVADGTGGNEISHHENGTRSYIFMNTK